MKSRGERDAPRTGTQRIVSAAFGVFFVLLAVVIWAEGSMGVGEVIAALVVGLLGVDACIGAFRGKRSLLERIGPLP